MRNKMLLNPEQSVVVVNDISESPDLSRLSELGYQIISLWHVDVVDFFNRFYLKNLLRSEILAGIFNRIQGYGLTSLVPDILRLVFEKQQQAIQYSYRIVLPSKKMAEILLSCYKTSPISKGGSLENRIIVLPWGGWRDEFSETDMEREAARLRTHYQINPNTLVLITLSRISPEKGIEILMEALRILETVPKFQQRDICLFVCGKPAFMQGEIYYRRVRTIADKLKKIHVFFPGHLSAFEKQAYFKLANLFVSPSVHESYGLTLVEAMQAGLPILASDHYGAKEILKPEFGRMVSYKGVARARSLAQALSEILETPEKLRSMGVAAKVEAQSMSFSQTARTLLDAALSLV
jgi:glycosyltransferase involved in cell wall biosynthesis